MIWSAISITLGGIDGPVRIISVDDGRLFIIKIKHQFVQNKELYEEMLEAGIAKECARFVLPLATPTRIYMTGSCRSWIHYINLRTGHGTQKDHMEIAQECKNIFSKEYPVVSSALSWLF